MVVGPDESLFCRVAVEGGFLTQDDIDRCLNKREKAASGKPLIVFLIEEGLIDDKKLMAIVEAGERTTMAKRRGGDRASTSSRSLPRFGEIAISKGLVTPQDVTDAVRIQSKEKARGRTVRIGQVLADRGKLSPDQVEEVLSAQNKRVVRCAGCRAKFNIAQFDASKSYQCRKCGFPLDPDESIGTLSAVPSVVAPSMVPIEEIGATLIGRRIGDFEIVEMVGEGGMAEVYKCVDSSTSAVRALKVLKSNAEEDRFSREIRNIRKIQHPNIIRIYDNGELDGKPYFFMDFVDGETLVQRMERIDIPPPEAFEILRQITEGLAAAHAQGVIHRDIKPSNILLDTDADGNLLVKVTDFGIARSATDTQVTVEGELLGTFKYMSPEHIKGQPIDGKSDVFSLGVLAYELLTGREPFEVDAPVGYLFVNIKEEPPPVFQVKKTLLKKFDLLVKKMMAKDPKVRYSAEGLLSDLVLCIDHLAGRGELADGENADSVFYVSGGRRFLSSVKNIFSFGTKRKVVHHAATPDEPKPAAPAVEKGAALLESQEVDLSETEALEFGQEAKLEYEWAMELLAEGNAPRARQSLKALVELAGPGSVWGRKAAEKLRDLDEGKVEIGRARDETESGEGAATDETALEDFDRELDRLEKESHVLESDDGESTIEEEAPPPPPRSELSRRLREEDLKTSQMILTDTSVDAIEVEEIDVELAQESLLSAKTFIDKVQSIAEYAKQRERLEAIFQRISGTKWEAEAAEELAEVLYKWGRFLLAHKRIEEGIDRYWLMVERYPHTRWAAQVVSVLSELDKPDGMTHVVGGKVLSGRSNGKPEYVQLAPFFMDENPVTNAAYKEFVDETGYAPPRHWKNRVYPLGKGNHPVVYVSWEDAAAYARWKGKRLPTEEEWARAASGENARTRWPWGDAFDESLCNTRDLGIGDTTPVGQYPGGRSASGCYDMIGNVWEWTDSWYDAETEKQRVLRGGSWFTFGEFSYIGYRNYDSPRARTRHYGFRCCRNFERPSPGSA